MSIFGMPLFIEGLALWRQGDPFAAHEVWEDLWMQLRGDERIMLQGLIQVAAGWVKLQRENRRGALSLLEKGAAKLAATAPFKPWIPQIEEIRGLLTAGELTQAKARIQAEFPRMPFPA